MQIGRVLNLKGFNRFLGFVLKNKLIILLIGLFVIGVSVSVFTYGDISSIKKLSSIFFENYIFARQNAKFFSVFIKSLLGSLLYIAFCFIFGSSVFGVVAVPACVLIRGCVYGSLTAFLYSSYSFEGVAFHAIILLLPSILNILALILSSIESINYSVLQIRLTLINNSDASLYNEFKKYCIKYLLYLILIFLSALSDGFLSVKFINNFEF